jgi:hypothetical protein
MKVWLVEKSVYEGSELLYIELVSVFDSEQKALDYVNHFAIDPYIHYSIKEMEVK